MVLSKHSLLLVRQGKSAAELREIFNVSSEGADGEEAAVRDMCRIGFSSLSILLLPCSFLIVH